MILNYDLAFLAMVLSHGHPDHTGGFREFSSLIGDRRGIEFVCHPEVFMKILDFILLFNYNIA